MKVRELPFVPNSAGRSSFPQWMMVAYHPPERGQIHSVRHGPLGGQFQAWLSYEGTWFEVEPEKDEQGCQELGAPLLHTKDLWYIGTIDGSLVAKYEDHQSRLQQGRC